VRAKGNFKLESDIIKLCIKSSVKGKRDMKEFDYSLENLKRTILADYFGRNAYIKNLINYINDSDEQTTFAISGDWGSGKTVFVHQFKTVLENQDMLKTCRLPQEIADKYEVFYFNAWENELLKKPTIAILNTLADKYYEIDLEDKEKAKAILVKIVNIAVKLRSSGVLSLDNVIESNDDEINISKINETFSDAIDYILRKTHHEKMIIIVDELDRCKPTSVVNLLEEVKHFYSHDSLCFIFSVDLRQLGHTIKKMYGTDFDSDLYLQRFFDAIFTLNGNNYEKYVNYELDYYISETHIAHEICKVAISYTNLTIREMNKFIKRIKAAEKIIFNSDDFNRDNYLAKAVFVPLGIALKYRSTKKYDAFINGEYTESEINEYLNTSKSLPRWIKECYLKQRHDTSDCDIYKVVFQLYQHIFKQTKFRYYMEESSGKINRESILSLIEF